MTRKIQNISNSDRQYQTEVLMTRKIQNVFQFQAGNNRTGTSFEITAL